MVLATFGLLNASTCAVSPDSQQGVGDAARVPGLNEGVEARDRAIKTAVLTSLRADPVLQQFSFEAEVNSGKVILRGTVAREKMKEKAESLAARNKGVEEVLNEIEVDTSLDFLDPMDEYSDSPASQQEDSGGWDDFEDMEGATTSD